MSAQAVTARGGDQIIPTPPGARPGRPAPWAGLSPAERSIDVERIREAFATGPPPVRSPAEAAGARASAVLAACFDEGDGASVVLTRRARHLRSHRGEVAFPGGGREGDESLWATALREAWEEVSLDPRAVEPVGELDHLSTVTSRAFIVPFVGALPAPPARLEPDPAEVDRVLVVPFAELLLDGVYREELWRWGDEHERPIHFFELHGDTVWGATAAMLRSFLVRALGLPRDDRMPI
ncbi:MAG TPA: CoA pyrophosphatase [Acidimicrobiales bacterium]|nr:CoA pyrophosphatase [Acidimicrobiales bacterium]